MKTVVEKHLGVTLAFAAGAILVIALLRVVDASGAGGGFTGGVDSWSAVGRSIIGTAVLAGAAVDGLRWAAIRLWPKDRKSRFPIGKVISQHLA